MKITNLLNQDYLFKNKNERYKLGARAVVVEAPDWVSENAFAKKLKEAEKISFEIKKKLTPFEQLKERATELGIVYGDGIKMANLEKMVANKEKELKDA